MSRLPNAPLVEVVFELRWQIQDKSDLLSFQYLFGDLYSELKNKYPVRESLTPPEIPLDVFINQPIYRYRIEKEKYPLYQIGPGILTVNTIDEVYFWDDFYKSSEEILDTFIGIGSFDKELKFKPSLLYFDFFPFDFSSDNVHDFLNEKFNITFKQNFMDESIPTNLNLGFYYKTKIGDIATTFQKGKNNKKNDGIVLRTKIDGLSYKLNKNDLLKWINDAHKLSSQSFKELTKGKLYETFK